jgi:membrane protein YqaA with SNARE-associated domain
MGSRVSEDGPPADVSAEPIDWSRSIRKLVIGLVGLAAVVILLAVTLRGPIEAVAGPLAAKFGLPGVLVGVFFLDVSPFSTHDPLLLGALSGGLPLLKIAATAGAGSLLATWSDYAIGRFLGVRFPWLKRQIDRYRITELFQRYGVWTVALAGLLPLPFAVVAWAAGAAHLPFPKVALGSLSRVIKITVTLLIMAVGWHVTS